MPRITRNEAKALARRLALALGQDEAYRLLGRAGLDCGFADGGCRILAEAIRRVLGGRLYAVYRDSGVMDHVALRLGSVYLDADGVHTEKGLLNNCRRATAGRFTLSFGPFCNRRADDSGIPYDEQAAAALTEYLRGRLHPGKRRK
jgi:hypothetical protein